VAGRTPPRVRVTDLTVAYGGRPAVAGVSLDLPAGTITGLVGESGSGKSTLALALLGAVRAPGRIAGGTVDVDGVGDVAAMPRKALRRVRGAALGYVFQAAQNSLNPLRTVAAQVRDLGRAHGVRDRAGLVRDAADLLARMGLDAGRVLDSYQHELSGGTRQRVGIMLALLLDARLLVLDEPTAALDTITQAAILRIVRDAHRRRGLTTLVVTHDLGVAAEIADRLAVMYAGRIVEQGRTAEVLAAPRHPYTRGLVAAAPRLSGDVDAVRPLPVAPTSATGDGCAFRERCPDRSAVCDRTRPPAIRVGGRLVACHTAGSGQSTPAGARP
jgi:peptide/nickel transport system ATP-binding protein